VAEQHGHELVPATETTGMALGPVLDDRPLKLGAGAVSPADLRVSRLPATRVLLMAMATLMLESFTVSV
jgi:hypothetical protein